MNTKEREVMELALATLESYEKSAYIKQSHPKRWANGNKAITTIKEALAQPEQEQEPVAIADGTFNHNCPIGTPLYTTQPQRKPCQTCESLARTVMMNQSSTDAPQREPWGACVSGRVFVGNLPEHVRKLSEDEGLLIQWLYTTPPQRTLAGLTDDEIMVVLGDFPFYASEWFEDDYYRFARAIEAAHGIRPTDFKE